MYGAAGEMAVAVYLDLKDELYKGICSQGLKRSARRNRRQDKDKTHYDLVVQLNDKPGKNYWLVTIENKEVRLHGWLPYSECTKEEYKKDQSAAEHGLLCTKTYSKSPRDLGALRARLIFRQTMVASWPL